LSFCWSLQQAENRGGCNTALSASNEEIDINEALPAVRKKLIDIFINRINIRLIPSAGILHPKAGWPVSSPLK
jgi:hypothetical protein